MNVQDAAHAIAHDYGVEEMAIRLGIRYKILNSQCNPNDPSHILGLVTAVRMQQLANRYDILYSMADTLDHLCIRKPALSDEDVGQATATVCVEFGQFLQEVTETMKDKRVTRNELKRMQRELTDLIAAATALHSMVAARSR